MIKLAKGSIPDVLVKNAATWTQEYIADIKARGDQARAKPARYAHPDVKSALRKETHDKCAYCESKFAHIAYGDVEHIVAKKVEPTLTYEWSNLTLACDICNTQKGSKTGFVDPYIDNPVDCIFFAGPWMAAALGSDSGKATVVVLQLNRTALMEKRKEKLDAFNAHFESIQGTKDPAIKRLLLDELLAEARSPRSEYSACIAAFISYLERH